MIDKKVKIIEENGEIYIVGKILEVDKKTPKGVIYSKKLIEEVIKKSKEKIKNKMMFGCNEHKSFNEISSHQFEIEFSKVSILIEDIYIENNILCVKALVLNTPQGKILKEMLYTDNDIILDISGVGELDENHKIYNYTLISIDAINDRKESWIAPTGFKRGVLKDNKFEILFPNGLKDIEDS